MITLKSCPNCSSKEFSFYRMVHWGSLISEITPGVKVKGSLIINYYLCKGCKLIFQNPRLSDKELDIFYSSGFYRKTVRKPEEGMKKGEENRALIDSEIIKKVIPNISSHLDIGCGKGYLLNVINADTKVGVETNPKYVTKMGIKIYTSLDKMPAQKFDLVTAIHLLEHVPRPLTFLKKMSEFVKVGGFLVIEVPSSRTPGEILGLPHMSQFEPDVLKIMCLKCGLNVVKIEFTPHLLVICQMAV